MKNGLIILSGGMDSVTLLHEYDYDIDMAVTFNYGSKHNEKEIVFAREHCQQLSINHIQIDLKFINEHFKSDLLKTGNEIPDGHYEDESMKRTVVPFRNGIMLSIAIGIAESYNLNKVYIGNHAGDHAIYPDCRAEFIFAMSSAAQRGTYNNTKIISPYQYLSKRDIALRGKKMGVDYSKTWTCYKGKEFHCGKCGACTERREALEGFDKTNYYDNQ